MTDTLNPRPPAGSGAAGWPLSGSLRWPCSGPAAATAAPTPPSPQPLDRAGRPAESSAAAPAASEAPASTEPVTLRLGYFPNVTHATALVGVGKGIFEEHLGDNVTLETSTFNAGTEASEALFADAIDMTYIGPNPAINAYAKSSGEAVRSSPAPRPAGPSWSSSLRSTASRI